jgi:hypothetical protein
MRLEVFVSLDEVRGPALADRRYLAVGEQSVSHLLNTTQSRGESSRIQIENELNYDLFL